VDATQTLEESTVQNHLIKRGNKYGYRRRIPQDLIAHYGGREVLTKTLGTSNRQEAARLARAMAVQHDEEFEAIRRQQSQTMTGSKQTTACLSFTNADLGESTESPSAPKKQMLTLPAPSFNELVKTEALAEAARLKRGIFEHRIMGGLKEFMAMERFRLMTNRAVLEGKENAENTGNYSLWKLQGIVFGQQEILEPGKHLPIKWLDEAPQQQTSTKAQAAPVQSDKHTPLDTLVGYWQQQGSLNNVRTIEKAKLVVSRFKEFIGDIPVEEITKQHCSTFSDQLRTLKKRDGKPVTIATVNDNLDKLRAILSVAELRGIIDRNPAAGLSLKDPVRAKDKRQPFDGSALARIFSSPVYLERDRPIAGGGEASYWLPLLALFTGARLEELGQLHPDDVRQESYEDTDGTTVMVWVLRITDEGEGQALKNAGSARRIPLHDELIRLGFIQFVESCQGKSRIFYQLKKDSRDRETGNWSKWFGRWLRQTCQVSDERMVFHSFRHTLKDLCRSAGIPRDVSDALTGHSGQSVADNYGASLFPLRPLVLGMRAIRLPAEVQAVIQRIPVFGS